MDADIGRGQGRRLRPFLQLEAAQLFPPFAHVFHFGTVFRRFVERGIGHVFIGYRYIEALAEGFQGLFTHLLLLVGDVLPLACLTHAVALDRLGKDDRGLSLVPDGCGIGGIDLVRVVSAPVQAPDILVGHVGDQGFQFRMLAEKFLPHIGSVVGLVGLVFPVHRFFHHLEQLAFSVAGD